MTIRALIVDDDVTIRESVGDIVASMGHDFECAGSQGAARALLSQREFDYVLLDLEIPVREDATFARPENGENLLADMRSRPTTKELPVIVMTAHGSDGPDLGVKQMKLGATDFVNKPFNGGQLDTAIQDALAKRRPAIEPRNGAHRAANPSAPPRDFAGGSFVMTQTEASLCGVTIVESTGRGHAWRILQLLCERNQAGQFRSYSGRQLAERLGRRVAQNAVSQCIRALRKRITNALLEQANVRCGDRDVIQSGGPGYRLNPAIEIRGAVSADTRSAAEINCRNGTREETAESAFNERQQWILDQLRASNQVRRRDVEAHCRCSSKTAKRDLAELRDRGLIEFVAKPWPGHYQCVQAGVR